jgi:hypothetical protein
LQRRYNQPVKHKQSKSDIEDENTRKKNRKRLRARTIEILYL